MITVTARNRELEDIGGKNLNEEAVGGGFVNDPKRRRTDMKMLIENNGQVHMQTNGLGLERQENEVLDPKNLKMTGSGYQARLAP